MKKTQSKAKKLKADEKNPPKIDGFAYRAGQEEGVVQLPGPEPHFRVRWTTPPHDQASEKNPKQMKRTQS